MKETVTVFYAWQSDHPAGHCRNLIKDALDAAAKKLTEDPSVPFQIEVDQDTKGVPGLCDIPATILAKIEKCDALVADLTYIAQSLSDPPRYCSNPNVLFELGFAFRAIKPERLILVMNEHYGPVENQIFDLDHRRHPVAYSFPNDKPRNTVVKQLAKNLEAALRPIVALGPASKATVNSEDEDSEELVRMRAQLKKLWSTDTEKAEHYWEAGVYPVRPRMRWNRAAEVENAVRARKSHASDGHEFPPQVKGNQPHGWGIANTKYGEPWIATKSGIFLYRQPMEYSQSPYPVPRYPSYEPAAKHVAAGKWVNILSWRERAYTFFDFAQRWTGEFESHEELMVELSAPVAGLHLVAPGTTLDRFIELIEPSAAEEYRFSRQITRDAFQTDWKDLCADAIDEFVELFPPTLGQGFPSSHEWVRTHG